MTRNDRVMSMNERFDRERWEIVGRYERIFGSAKPENPDKAYALGLFKDFAQYVESNGYFEPTPEETAEWGMAVEEDILSNDALERTVDGWKANTLGYVLRLVDFDFERLRAA